MLKGVIVFVFAFLVMIFIYSIVFAGSMRTFTGDNIQYSATMESPKSNDTGKYTVILQRASGIWAIDVVIKNY